MKVAMIAGAWRTPLGDTLDGVMARLDERASGTARIAQAPSPSKQARYLRRMGLFGLEVAGEALAASGISGGPRVGLFAGVGGLRVHWDDVIAAFEHQREDGERMWERGLRDIHPYWMLRHLSNNVHAIASTQLGLRGEGATFGGANGGAQAIASAARALHDDAIDAALVVAYDSLLEPETLVELAPLIAQGYVPGEAAAAIVLVRESPAALATIVARDGIRNARGCAGELVDGTQPMNLQDAFGHLGAATAVVHAIAFAELRRERPLLGLYLVPPDLAAAIRVERA